MKAIRRIPIRQKGASMFAIIMVMVLLGLVILTGLKISPAYLDNQVVKTALVNLQSSGEMDSMSIREVRNYVARTMQTNGAPFDGESLQEVEERGVEYIEVRYESRVSLFDSIDAIVKFDYRVEK